MVFVICLIIPVYLASIVHALPPDKIMLPHKITARSIDLNNAHILNLERKIERVIEPTGYRLELEPYIEDGLFRGHVRINLTWLQDTDELNLHCAHELEITGTEVKAKMGRNAKYYQKIEINRMLMDVKKPRITINLKKVVPRQSIGFIDFSFHGTMQTVFNEAFFKVTYNTDQDTMRYGAATQLRPNNARRMFPCFDEPSYKTPFQLSIVRPRDMVALSNVPLVKTENITGEPNAVWDYFEKTPEIPTFTFGFVIANLKQLASTTVDGIDLRLWSRPEFHSALDEVQAKVVRVFKELNDFWKIPLPLKKLDIVALPHYQGVKPIDNWGLIIFKESDLSSRGYLQLAQELTYQWVGALATPFWWSESHLNKALVGYIAAEITFKIDNGAEMEGKWPMTVLYSLYYEFSKRYPHSRITGMKQETASTKIELLFRMFNYTLGEDVFKSGIRLFVDTKKFKTFSGVDVWRALNKALVYKTDKNEIDIPEIAKSWIDKDRLPIITVQRDYTKNIATFRQKVYLRERPHDVPDAEQMIWWIPLVIAREDKLHFTNFKPTEWMNSKEFRISNMPDSNNFIIVNPEEIAPYPVNYDEHNWYLLSKFLQGPNRTIIPELTRAKLLHDAWNLAYAGELSFATALNMTLFLKEEDHHLVWDPVFTMIDHIGRHICQCVHPKFNAYVRTLLAPLYDKLIKDEKEDEPSWRKNLRTLTKTFLCKAGYKQCIQEAQEQYSKWMQAEFPDEGNPISNPYICPVFKWGTKAEWEFGLQRVINFPSSRKQSERTYLLKTLAGCPIDEYKIIKLLNITVLEGNSNFTETDIFLIFSMLSGSPHGYTTLFHFVNNNWAALKAKYSHKTNIWDSLISAATSQFTTQEGLEQVSILFVAHQGEFGSAEYIIEKAIKNLKEEAQWSTDNLPVIHQWLDKYLTYSKVKDYEY